MIYGFLMIIGGSNLVIIILLGLVLLFGTKKLPQLSRTLGKAIGEYNRAKEMVRKEMQEANQSKNPASGLPRITGPVATEREKLETMASTLGIDPTGIDDNLLRS